MSWVGLVDAFTGLFYWQREEDGVVICNWRTVWSGGGRTLSTATMRWFPLSTTSNSERERNRENTSRTSVYLNVYDLTPINNYLYMFGLGIFHSGIQGLCVSFPYTSFALILLFWTCFCIFLFFAYCGMCRDIKKISRAEG